MKIIVLPIAFLCILSSPLWAQPAPPAGWRYPTEADRTGAWKDFRGAEAPFHVRGDFNGDGLDDDVCILLATGNDEWGLFLFEAQKTGAPRVVELEVVDPKKGHGRGPAQNMGVKVAPWGDRRTACGKGYWACAEGEPEVLHLDRAGISYFQFESAESIFWWDAKKKEYRRTWISD